MSVKELKEELHLSSTDTLNVFFASNSVREELAGAATWPWAKEALTQQGNSHQSPCPRAPVGLHSPFVFNGVFNHVIHIKLVCFVTIQVK